MLTIPVAIQFQVMALTLLAAVLGAIIGLERQRLDKPAGTRTMALVSSASALIVAIGAAGEHVAKFGDPSRALQAVITGVGFLGAGTIMQGVGGDSKRTTGVTTAATVFSTAAIGVTVGMGGPVVAIGATFIVLAVLRGGHYLDRYFNRVSNHFSPNAHTEESEDQSGK